MRHIRRALSLLALARLLHGQALPYNPTQLSLPANSSTVYMFRPSAQSSNQAQLLTLDVSGSLASTSLPWKTVSETLPFLREDEPLPYTPVFEADGSITVVTGNCSEGADGLQLWRYGDEDGGHSWKQFGTAVHSGADDVGPHYLASSIAFSELVDSSKANTNTYVFGGMCPTGAATTNTWQGAAEYSNSMLTLQPGTSDDDASKYDVSVLENRGPPIPQAGISITPLSPTYSLSSSGSPQTQEQDFVLLGGHTQAAFINTSQVAVFSLPQQSWSFMPVQQPSDARSDLVRRQGIEVTPRSGHTAVLTEDGRSIVLFGGWVGDVSTPATPQLAKLSLGDGYGGSGNWMWIVPENPARGPSGSAGIYGHGAIMLPGGVMMVVGGYEISPSTARRFKRNAPSTNNGNLFYNVTSNTWLDSYTIPAGYPAQPQQSSGPLSTTSQRVGLGTGLGIGAALLVSVVVVYFWYSKRVQRAREGREQSLLVHSSDGSSLGQMEQSYLDAGGIDEQGGDGFGLGRFWPAQSQPSPRPPPMQHTTGMFVNVPSPTRGLRRGVAAKNYQYQPAPRYDDNRLSRGSGNIHPIAEQENEDEVASIKSDREQLDDAEAKLREIERVLSDDPFLEPTPNPLGSHPVSPEVGDTLRRVPTVGSRVAVPARKPIPSGLEVPNWTVEPGLDEYRGRISPSKSEDRTSSTLSERSQRSVISDGSIQRTMSTQTGAILAAAMAAQRRSVVLDGPPTQERTQTMSTDASYFHTRARASTNGSATPGTLDNEYDSFTTARTTFTHLQTEGEALLGGRPSVDPDDPYRRALAAQTPSQFNAQAPSYSKGAPPMAGRRKPGWMGSLRRVLNVAERSFSLTGSAEQYKDDPRSASSSPTKDRGGLLGPTPRRAVSDGGALLRQKRGEKDWDEKDWAPYRDDPEDWGQPKVSMDKNHGEEDWDVEGAANKRDFQVMFTVPKARLRVVNDDMDRASLRSASDGAVSRSGSTKDLRREDSLKVLKARMGGEERRLPSTEEEMDDAEKEKAA